jgi:hypothetical protein
VVVVGGFIAASMLGGGSDQASAKCAMAAAQVAPQ